ncbi:MAG: beta-N-acetylhexosaminidase [Sphingomonadales bacterium]|jgi:beta-N-acetylhexosaminidase|nr:beta-N-acetylhexosaminidase [Sphingomonadales bacterium]
MLAAILGLSGPSLTDDERALFRAADPAGFILFGRNVVDKAQLRALTDSLRDLAGRADLPVLIDQEGGRVARLKPPAWPEFPAQGRFGALYELAPISAIEAARVNAEALGLTVAEMGINVDCLPLLDLPRPGADAIIGDRAWGSEPMRVAALGRAVLDGLEAAGICGVVKHIPGHGRARADSHEALPVVDASEEELAIDLAPFRALRDAPMAMTAHILYPAWDADHPATTSPKIIAEIIRGAIGFDGLLMSDDLAMKALSGTPGDRARATIEAGCDVVLHCSGEMMDNEAIAGAAGAMSEAALKRLARAMARIAGKASTQSYEALAAKRDALLAYA